jgi:hypothetical protein
MKTGHRKPISVLAMAPVMARRYAAMREEVDDRLRRIAALSGVLAAIGQASAGSVDLDDVSRVAGMIREGAYDILEALNDFAAPGDLWAEEVSGSAGGEQVFGSAISKWPSALKAWETLRTTPPQGVAARKPASPAPVFQFLARFGIGRLVIR